VAETVVAEREEVSERRKVEVVRAAVTGAA